MLPHRLKQLAPDLVVVPAGSFTMGTTEAAIESLAARFTAAPEELRSETPAHEVTLDSYEISRGPITCGEYRAFMIATDRPAPEYWGGEEPPTELVNHPVVAVTLTDARDYCRWLSTATQRDFRVPTEAQWEKAARGTDGRAFPWGDEWDESFCNTAASELGTTSAVGSFAHDTSPYGCVDMAGNVAEWTFTRYRPYPDSDFVLPLGPSEVAMRGASWSDTANLARCACRQHSNGDASMTRGFRVVCAGDYTS